MNAETKMEIAEPLLETLRSALGDPALGYAAPPVRLTGGQENDIFAFQLRAAARPFDQPLVARIFRSRGVAPRTDREVTIQGSVAEQGFATPRVLFTDDGSHGVGRPFLIMERAPGSPMLVDAMRRPWRLLPRMPSLLASTAAALHRLDVEAVLAAAEAAGIERQSMILDPWEQPGDSGFARSGLPSLEELGGWLDRHRPAPRKMVITHGDFHPLNLMIDRGRVSAVLDWGGSAIAPRERDLAVSRILIRYGPSGVHGITGRLLDLYRRGLLRRYEALYRAEHPVDEELIRYFEAFRAFHMLDAVAEWRIERAISPRSPELELFHLSKITARVARISGIHVELPPRPIKSDCESEPHR